MAILFSYSRLLKDAFYPFALISRAIPIIAFTPLLVIVLGRGLPPVIAVVSISVYFPAFLNMMRGLASADVDYHEMLHTLSATPLAAAEDRRLAGLDALPLRRAQGQRLGRLHRRDGRRMDRRQSGPRLSVVDLGPVFQAADALGRDHRRGVADPHPSRHRRHRRSGCSHRWTATADRSLTGRDAMALQSETVDKSGSLQPRRPGSRGLIDKMPRPRAILAPTRCVFVIVLGALAVCGAASGYDLAADPALADRNRRRLRD